MCRIGTYMITQLDIQIRTLPADVRSAVLGSAIPDTTSQRPDQRPSSHIPPRLPPASHWLGPTAGSDWEVRDWGCRVRASSQFVSSMYLIVTR